MVAYYITYTLLIRHFKDWLRMDLSNPSPNIYPSHPNDKHKRHYSYYEDIGEIIVFKVVVDG